MILGGDWGLMEWDVYLRHNIRVCLVVAGLRGLCLSVLCFMFYGLCLFFFFSCSFLGFSILDILDILSFFV
jgi:hypothetical protein